MRFATFAHAISSTKSTAPKRIQSAVRILPTTNSSSGVSRSPQLLSSVSVKNCLRPLDGDAGLHARADVQVLAPPTRRGRELFGAERHRGPEVRRLAAAAELRAEVEGRGHDADDRVRLAVEHHVLADDGEPREAPVPEAVAEDYDLVAPRL